MKKGLCVCVWSGYVKVKTWTVKASFKTKEN